MAAPAFRVVGTVVSGLGAITPAPNAGHVSGDVELLFVETANEAATLSTAAGFAQVTGTGVGVGTAAGTDGTRMTVFWRRWNGSDGSPTVADSGNHQIAVIASYSGVIASGNPWNVVGSNQQTPATTSGSASGVTTSVATTLIVVATAGAQPDASTTTEFSAWTNGSLGSLTERVDQTVTAGNGGAIGVADGSLAGAGASGATTFTSATSTTKDNVVIALAPPPAAFNPANGFPYIDEQQDRSVQPTWAAATDTGGEFVRTPPAAGAFDPASQVDWGDQLQAWQQPPWFVPGVDIEARPTTFPKAAPRNLAVTPNLTFDNVANVSVDWPPGLSQYDRIQTLVNTDSTNGWTTFSQDSPSPSYTAPTTFTITIPDSPLAPIGAFIDVALVIVEQGKDQFGVDPVPDLGRPPGLSASNSRGYYTAVVRFPVFRPPTFAQPDLSMQEVGLSQQWFAPDADVDTGLPNTTFAFDPAIKRDWSEQPQVWQQPPWFAPDAEAGVVLPPAAAAPFTTYDFAHDSSGQQDRSIAQAWFAPDAEASGLTPVAFNPASGFPWVRDEQQDRATGPAWFAPDAEVAGLVPPAAAGFDPATGFPYVRDEQQDRSVQPTWHAPEVSVETPIPNTVFAYDPSLRDWQDQPQAWLPAQWFAPDAEQAPPVYATLPPIVDNSTPASRAPLWIDQQPELWRYPVWYSPATEPVDGPLQSWLFTTGAPGTPGAPPSVLINAENGDVFLSIGGVLIVPAS